LRILSIATMRESRQPCCSGSCCGPFSGRNLYRWRQLSPSIKLRYPNTLGYVNNVNRKMPKIASIVQIIALVKVYHIFATFNLWTIGIVFHWELSLVPYYLFCVKITQLIITWNEILHELETMSLKQSTLFRLYLYLLHDMLY